MNEALHSRSWAAAPEQMETAVVCVASESNNQDIRRKRKTCEEPPLKAPCEEWSGEREDRETEQDALALLVPRSQLIGDKLTK